MKGKYSRIYGWHYVKRVKDLKVGDVIVQAVNRGMGQIDGRIKRIDKLTRRYRILLENTCSDSIYFKSVITTRLPHSSVHCRSKYGG